MLLQIQFRNCGIKFRVKVSLFFFVHRPRNSSFDSFITASSQWLVIELSANLGTYNTQCYNDRQKSNLQIDSDVGRSILNWNLWKIDILEYVGINEPISLIDFLINWLDVDLQGFLMLLFISLLTEKVTINYDISHIWQLCIYLVKFQHRINNSRYFGSGFNRAWNIMRISNGNFSSALLFTAKKNDSHIELSCTLFFFFA